MKKLLLALAVISGPAFGIEYNVKATVTKVTPFYKEITQQIPQQSCQIVEVPIYDEASTGDVFLGSVIGGAIGNQIGEGSGKDAATVIGAILGAHKAQENDRTVIGYRRVEQCSTTYQTKTVSEVTHYNVELKAEGNIIATTMYQPVKVGDTFFVKKTVDYTLQ